MNGRGVYHCTRYLALPVVFVTATSGCETSSSAERDLVHADAEIFEAVARSESLLSPADSSRSPRFLRIDSRPVDNISEVSPGAATPTSLDLSTDSAQLSSGTIERITQERRAILKRLGVEEGGPFFFPGCGGVRTGRGELPSAVAKCPTEWRRYVTVGVPHRGAGQILEKLRRPESQGIDTSGVWTVLVTESSVGTGGEDWKQYAWVFTPHPGRLDLRLAAKFLLSWAE